jgi:hypothetical protein
MAYSEQTASSPDDIINKIAVFAVANGWTAERNTLAGANRTLTLRYATTTDYIHVYNTDTSNILILGSVTYNGATTPILQTQRSAPATANIGVGPYTKIYMFASATPSPHIHCVIEMTGGIFRHLSFGLVDKLGTWTGGTYVDATYWNTTVGPSVPQSYNTWNSPLFDSNSPNYSYASHNFAGSMRCDIPLDSRVNAWAHLTSVAPYRAYTGLFGGTSNSSSSTGNGYLSTQFLNRNEPPFSGQVTLGAIAIEILRVGGLYSIAGTFPNVRFLSMLRFNPGQEVTVGSDVWKIFPMARKGTTTVNYDTASQNNAYAFLKTV